MSRNSARRDRERTQDRNREPQVRAAPDSDCPCGTGRTYADCCGAIHDGRATASTAEQLMRSRYSAFAVRDLAYLLKSWHPSTRPATLDLEPATRWTGLTILGTTDGSAFHTEGTVEFEARYVDHGEPSVLTENSLFIRENGDWVYVKAL